MKKLSLLLFVVLLGLSLTSCDERPGQIEDIKNNAGLSNEDKILEIVDIATYNLTLKTNTSLETGEDGKLYVYVEYTDETFEFPDSETMQEVAKVDIAKAIWRILHDTKDLNVNGVDVLYNGNIMIDGNMLEKQDVLVYQIEATREQVESISGFYNEDPYSTGEYDVFEADSEQRRIAFDIIDNSDILVDNSGEITF